jgi:hypothetical protein
VTTPERPGTEPPGSPYPQGPAGTPGGGFGYPPPGPGGYQQPGYQEQPGYQQPGYQPEAGYQQQPGYPPAGPQPTYPPQGPPSYTPPPGTPGYGAAPRRSRRSGLVALGVLVVLVILVVGGLALFRDKISGNVTELQVGDCFDEPVGATTVSDVQHHPCTEAHDGEVFLLVNDNSPSYPGADHFRAIANSQCTDSASAYIGTDYNARDDLSGGFFYPTTDSWSSGDRAVTCYLDRTDKQKLTISLKNIGTSPVR